MIQGIKSHLTLTPAPLFFSTPILCQITISEIHEKYEDTLGMEMGMGYI